MEVLRTTGVRAEELLELNHHSLVQYRLPTTGQIVPLLQILPSKTDTERLLVVSPELAEVLSAIISRIRLRSGAVPLVSAYDTRERLWAPPAPVLFQRRVGTESRAISTTSVGKFLSAALINAGLNNAGQDEPLHYTPHDFRRMFITDAILGGLPPHIAQVIAGHRDINVTLGYKAIYPEETIQAHLAFLARRRSLRPTEEYRVPTDDEWQEFLGHFERRKVSIGTCARAFGSPCIHEHACVRCSMLWPDPDQRPRLVDIRDNLLARITEAQKEGWLGEIEGLQVSLAGATEKSPRSTTGAPPAEPTPSASVTPLPESTSRASQASADNDQLGVRPPHSVKKVQRMRGDKRDLIGLGQSRHQRRAQTAQNRHDHADEHQRRYEPGARIPRHRLIVRWFGHIDCHSPRSSGLLPVGTAVPRAASGPQPLQHSNAAGVVTSDSSNASASWNGYCVIGSPVAGLTVITAVGGAVCSSDIRSPN